MALFLAPDWHSSPWVPFKDPQGTLLNGQTVVTSRRQPGWLAVSALDACSDVDDSPPDVVRFRIPRRLRIEFEGDRSRDGAAASKGQLRLPIDIFDGPSCLPSELKTEDRHGAGIEVLEGVSLSADLSTSVRPE